MDGVVALGEALELAHQHPVLQVPEVDALALHVHQRVAAGAITYERHYGMVFFDAGKERKRILVLSESSKNSSPALTV